MQGILSSTSLRQVHALPQAGIELRISYYEEQPAADYTMPDVLEITCQDEMGKMKKVNVYVERPVAQKPYLGGSAACERCFHHWECLAY